MEGKKLRLLTVVAEAILEDMLIDDIQRLGATGYTILDARGWGKHGKRRGNWRQGGNIRIEVLGSDALCAAIAEYLRKHYQDDYGLLIFTTEALLHN
ncbi:P-II family nitrogen regulator [Thioalkalivibrio sulfidiphilus]|uniref:P-II family nitrogen regulator n=1 Tax=Thioalkalivibrio sulfidiphilus TaxID=1033854 RepID=UPI003B36FB36